MSPSRPTRKRPKRTARSSGFRWWKLWPLLLGIAVTPFAVRAAGVLALTGPTALRLLYPFVVLVGNEAQHLSGEQVENLSQIILWGQFPLYGLLWFLVGTFVLPAAGPLVVLLLHICGAAAAILTAGA